MNILLVDDNEINRRLFVDLLEHQGHSVCVAVDGQGALDHFKRAKFDLILMDMQMPIMNGYEAIAQIRSIEKSLGGHTHIVAVTALAMDGDRERCLEVGADDYLSKPIHPRLFLDWVAKLARTNKSASTDQVECLDVQHGNGIVYDEELALKRFMGKRELLNQVVEMFLGRYPQYLSDIKGAIKSGNAEAICNTAHAFKGAIGNLGTHEAFVTSQKLEDMGRSGDIEHASKVYDVLKIEIEKLVAALRVTQQ